MAVSGWSGHARGTGAPLIALLLVTGCQPPPPPPPADPAPSPGTRIAYTAPPGEELTYALADTVTLSFAGGVLSNVRIEGGYHATVATAWEPVDSLFRVTARVEDFSGELRNPMAGNTRATEADVDGAWVVRVSPRGRTELLERPTVARRFRDVVGTDDLLRNMFLRLPPSAIRPGDRWTDTIQVEERTSTERESSTAIVTSTWAGDTMVGGRPLRVIRSTTESSIEIEAVSDGTRVIQRLEGGTTAETLFDSDRGVIVRASEQGLLSGTLDVPDAGLDGVPLTARVRRHLSLVPGG